MASVEESADRRRQFRQVLREHLTRGLTEGQVATVVVAMGGDSDPDDLERELAALEPRT